MQMLIKVVHVREENVFDVDALPIGKHLYLRKLVCEKTDNDGNVEERFYSQPRAVIVHDFFDNDGEYDEGTRPTYIVLRYENTDDLTDIEADSFASGDFVLSESPND